MQEDNRETQAPNVPNNSWNTTTKPHSMNVRASDAKRAKGQRTGSVLQNVVEKVRGAENVLVALSNDPNVDEMAAAIGLSMLLESLEKHATAIYSGKTPNVLEFLRPEETFETNTNGLQDFIIALDKEKADHLRYKVDGDFVKVYITPYRTTLSQGDLAFSRGDFNIDLVISLNVAAATDLDAALREYGRIMHDATAINITNGVAGKFGDVEWVDPSASSVSEMVAALAFELKEDLDKSVATALLTGIVAATDKFANEATTPEVMMLAAKLMKLGANQQEVFKNISQELEYVEREVADAEVSTATEELQRETERVGQDDGELKVEPENEEKSRQVEPEKVIEPLRPAESTLQDTQTVVSEEAAEGEQEIAPDEVPAEEGIANDVIVTPEDGPEKTEGESLADQILSKIRKQEDEGADAQNVVAGETGTTNASEMAGIPGVSDGQTNFNQMIDQVSAEPMPGEVGTSAQVEMPMVTMQPNVAKPVDSAQEEAAAMDVIRQANAKPVFPEGMELPTVIPGGGSSVNPISSTVTPAVPTVPQSMAPATDVPTMDLRPMGAEASSTNVAEATENFGGAASGGMSVGEQSGLPMPGGELGTPPTPPMPDFSTMPDVQSTMPPAMGSATQVASQAPAENPGMTDPGSYQIPPVAF